MGRSPCCDESKVKKGPWTPEEDEKLIDYITKHGHGSWRTLSKRAGLNRCGKSCRLRWTNYLRPDIKRGKFTEEEEQIIINLHSVLGNKWSKIAAHLPGRTDNEIKNFWNTHIRKKLLHMGIDPETHKPRTDFNHLLMNLSQLIGMSSNLGISAAINPFGLQTDFNQLANLQLLQNMLQIMNSNDNSYFLGGNPRPSLNPFNIALVNEGSNSTLQTKEAVMLGGQEYANPGLFSQTPESDSSLKDVSKSSWNDVQVVDCNKIRSTSSVEVQEENNVLPALVVASSPGMGRFNQMENNSYKTGQQIISNIQSPSTNTIFDDWEKFLNDETNGSCWKDFLDLTSSSASPIS